MSNKEAIKDCFTTNDAVFMTRPKSATMKYMGYNGAFFGLGPLGPYWHKMRKLTTLELLSNRRLDSLQRVRASEVGSCIKELYFGACGGVAQTKVNMSQWFRRVTINMTLQMIIESRQFGKAVKEFVYLALVFELSDVIPRMEWLDLQGRVRAMKRTAKEMDYFMSKWLEEHIQKRQNGDVKEEESDFMDVMLSLLGEDELVEGHKSGTVIKATTQLFILASFETPSIPMTWALSLLLNHNQALKLVQEELDTRVGRQRWVEESHIINLSYLQAIVTETLRLYPPGPLSILRQALSDCHVAGYHVPKGTCLIVNLWKLHKDPKIWANPNEFQPKRFLFENVKMDVKR
ncbi:Xanthotoxin 5-hydroxylase CYP82C4 [Camellia lanceoleosa]|uniref:Xanthotoxin 5-hydroxylase CYP82C4 n=1 Tax=Camellia lanceoleosa TaxID=1840588 RepID=A0ACC0GJF8_9ERIC|nr:Xanthotoxin 5-hydroxylase CYP82C4 [Camellia lanceoleosa]